MATSTLSRSRKSRDRITLELDCGCTATASRWVNLCETHGTEERQIAERWSLDHAAQCSNGSIVSVLMQEGAL